MVSELTIQHYARQAAELNKIFSQATGKETIVREMYNYDLMGAHVHELEEIHKDFHRTEKDEMTGKLEPNRSRDSHHQRSEVKSGYDHDGGKKKHEGFHTFLMLDYMQEQYERMVEYQRLRELQEQIRQQIVQILDQMKANAEKINHYDQRWENLEDALADYDEDGMFSDESLDSEAVKDYLRAYQERTGTQIFDSEGNLLIENHYAIFRLIHEQRKYEETLTQGLHADNLELNDALEGKITEHQTIDERADALAEEIEQANQQYNITPEQQEALWQRVNEADDEVILRADEKLGYVTGVSVFAKRVEGIQAKRLSQNAEILDKASDNGDIKSEQDLTGSFNLASFVQEDAQGMQPKPEQNAQEENTLEGEARVVEMYPQTYGMTLPKAAM